MTDDKFARVITWAGGQHTFNLNHPWVRNVLKYRGIHGANGNTPAACLLRFETGTYSIEDIERVLELGLIGGGMDKQSADSLLDQHVRGKPIATLAVTAVQVLETIFIGAPQ